jgi:hypothetical protein
MYGKSDRYGSLMNFRGFGSPGVDCALPSVYAGLIPEICDSSDLRDDEEFGGLFPALRTKRKLKKIEKIYGKIIGLVEVGQLDDARDKAQKLCKIWDKTLQIHGRSHGEDFQAEDYIRENAPNLFQRMERMQAFVDGKTDDPRKGSAPVGGPGAGVTGSRKSIFDYDGGVYVNVQTPGWRRPPVPPMLPPRHRPLPARGPGGAHPPIPLWARPAVHQALRDQRGPQRGRYGALRMDASQFIFPEGRTVPYEEPVLLREDLFNDQDVDEIVDEARFGALRVGASDFALDLSSGGEPIGRNDLLKDLPEIFGGMTDEDALADDPVLALEDLDEDLDLDAGFDAGINMAQPVLASTATPSSDQATAQGRSQRAYDRAQHRAERGVERTERRDARRAGRAEVAETAGPRRRPLAFLHKDTQRKIERLQDKHKRQLRAGSLADAAKTLVQIQQLQNLQLEASATGQFTAEGGGYTSPRSGGYKFQWQPGKDQGSA